MGLSYFAGVFPVTRHYLWCQRFLPWLWSLTYIFENFNLDHNFGTITRGASIFHMCNPCDTTFPSVSKRLTLRPSSWNLTLIKTYGNRSTYGFHISCVYSLLQYFSVSTKIFDLNRDLWSFDLDCTIRRHPYSTEHILFL